MFEIYFINVEDIVLFHVGISLSNDDLKFHKVSTERATIGYRAIIKFRHHTDETKQNCLDGSGKDRKGKFGVQSVY